MANVTGIDPKLKTIARPAETRRSAIRSVVVKSQLERLLISSLRPKYDEISSS